MVFAMPPWLAGSHLADVVLAATLVELAALAAWRGRRLPLAAVARTLLPGVLLTLALRVALSGGAAMWVALCLLLAGVAHGVDLAGRRREVQ